MNDNLYHIHNKWSKNFDDRSHRMSCRYWGIEWSLLLRTQYAYKLYVIIKIKLDGCIAWNAHNTVFGSKRSATCAQAVYFLHSTMPSVTYLRLSDVSVICRVTYFHFPIQVCFSSMSVSQVAQRRTWFTQYWTSDVAENLGRFLLRSVQPREMIFELLL